MPKDSVSVSPDLPRQSRNPIRGRLRVRHFAIAVTMLAVFVGLRIWDPAPVQALRLQVFDLYQRIQPRVASTRPVVIVDIDDQSLTELGQWPWPRNLIADMVDRLFRLRAVVVGFDVVFAEPDRLSPHLIIQQLPALGKEAVAALQALPSNDAFFAESLRRGRVVLGQAPTQQNTAAQLRPLARKSALAEVGGDPRRYMFAFGGIVRNIEQLEQSAKGLGSITSVPDVDGVARRVPLVVRVGGEVIPSLSVEMLRLATGQSTVVVRSNVAGIDSVIVGGVAIQTERDGRKWVHFAPPDPARYVSAADVLRGSVAPERIAGKLVLVGTSATGLKDVKTTPMSPETPGVEVHAQLLEAVLSGSNLVRPNYALGAELTALVGITLVVAALTAFGGALATLGVGGVLATGLTTGSWYLYSREGVLIDIAFPAIGAFAVYAVLVYARYVREESERKSVRRAFGQYLSPALVDQLASDPSRLALGGERRTMTFLFSDVRGFTSISERYKADPTGLTRLINRFLTPMTDVILARNGTIDKYMGDCIMAFWNAPLPDHAHATHALEAALGMIQALAILNAELRAEALSGADGKPAAAPVELQIGIGLNTGDCVVGNMGSRQRFDYSVLGDAVNLASRLESQSKVYGVVTVIGEETAAAAVDFPLIELDLIAVKGKTEPARIFTILGDRSRTASREFQELRERHDRMLTCYRAQSWSSAQALLAECRALAPELTALYDLYAARIAAFEASPPASDWKGVYVAETK